MIEEIFEIHSLAPRNVISIGDRSMDYIDGKAAGIDNFILATYGWPCDESNIPAEVPRAHSPEQIPHAIDMIRE